jgi:hypothetical protein
LAVVQLPIPRQDAALALQPLEERGAGERRQDRETREVDVLVDDELSGLLKPFR